MKKVLIISHFFPPRPSIGSNRPGGLAKYLPKFGWEPVIITTTLPGPTELKCQIIQTDYHKDFSYRIKKFFKLNPEFRLDQQSKPILIPGKKDSILLKVAEFIFGIMNYPDDLKGWMPFALKAGKEILSREKIDMILSTSHPVTAHLIARKLKNASKVPWVADLRDLWTQNPYYQYGPVRKFFERQLELKTLSHADALVTVSSGWADKLKEIHQNRYIESILSGFDPEEVQPASLSKEFTITYTGRFYDGKRDPSLLFEALADLLKEGLIDSKLIKIEFWGSKNYWLEEEIKKFKFENITFQCGMVPREEVLRHQRESQLLLMINWNSPRDQNTYTGKIYEYLAARRPILAIGPQGVVSKLLDETKAGYHATDLITLKKVILNCYQEFQSQGQICYQGDWEKVNKYNQVEMARQFAQLFEKII